MKRQALVLLSVMLMAGCATNRSNYYSQEGSGDYYYGANTADVVIASSGYSYGFGGYGAGFGPGCASGFGYPNPCWRYPYRDWDIPMAPQWIPKPQHGDPASSRSALVEQNRAERAALVRRDTVAAPRSAELVRNQPASSRSLAELRGSVDARGTRSTRAQRAASSYSAAPTRQAPMVRSMPAMNRSGGMSAPMRSAPPARPVQRSQ